MQTTSLQTLLAEAGVFPDLVRLLPDGEGCYLVGGALRDWHLGREVADFDFAASFDPTPVAQRFAKAVGGVWFMLDEPRCQSRVVGQVKGRTLTYDFARFRARELEGDLRLRDFTINALALRLADGTEPGNPIDVLGSLHDLDDRCLRSCSDGVFWDDPLRVLKGVRHAAVLGLEIDEKTLALMQDAAQQLVRIAPERIRSELALLFAVEPVARGLALLDSSRLTPILFGPSRDGALATGIALAGRAGAAALALDRQLAEEEIEGGLTRAALVKMAAFLRGHGADPATIAAGLRLGRQATAVLTSLARLAPEQGRALELQPPTPRGLALRAGLLGPDPAAALALLAGIADDPVAETLRRLQPYLAAWRQVARGGRVPDLVDGDWVRDHLGLGEGPEIGAALAAVREAELSGTVTGPDEARRWLLSRQKKGENSR